MWKPSLLLLFLDTMCSEFVQLAFACAVTLACASYASHQEEQLASVTVAAQRFEHHAITFEYQKIVYVFEDSPQSPRMLKYPTRSAIQDYMQWTGHSDETADVGARMWGRNFFDIPMPTFLELFRVCECKH
jgi:hypothetical protein